MLLFYYFCAHFLLLLSSVSLAYLLVPGAGVCDGASSSPSVGLPVLHSGAEPHCAAGSPACGLGAPGGCRAGRAAGCAEQDQGVGTFRI